MTKRLTVIYEVPDDYNVTRITGTGELNVVRCEWMDALQRLAAAEAALEKLRNGPLEWLSPAADAVRRLITENRVVASDETLLSGIRQLHAVAIANQERRYVLHKLLLEAAVGVDQKRFPWWLDEVRKALDITELELALEVFKANEAAKGGRDE